MENELEDENLKVCQNSIRGFSCYYLTTLNMDHVPLRCTTTRVYKKMLVKRKQRRYDARSTKAPGEEGLTNRQLKELEEEYVKYIANIATVIFRLPQFPGEWKNAIVIMIQKMRKHPPFNQNQRSISLLCCVEDLVEKLALERIQYECERYQIIQNE